MEIYMFLFKRQVFQIDSTDPKIQNGPGTKIDNILENLGHAI